MRISKGDQTTTLQKDARAKAVFVLLSSTHYVDPTVFLNAKDAVMPILGPLIEICNLNFVFRSKLCVGFFKILFNTFVHLIS